MLNSTHSFMHHFWDVTIYTWINNINYSKRPEIASYNSNVTTGMFWHKTSVWQTNTELPEHTVCFTTVLQGKRIPCLPGFAGVQFLFQHVIVLLQRLQVSSEFLCTSTSSAGTQKSKPVDQYNVKAKLQTTTQYVAIDCSVKMCYYQSDCYWKSFGQNISKISFGSNFDGLGIDKCYIYIYFLTSKRHILVQFCTLHLLSY